MNNILLNISITAIITAVFKLLVPEEKNSNQIKLLISCFFIVTVINIFKDCSANIDFSNIINTDFQYNDYSVVFEKQTADEAANVLRSKIKEQLMLENIIPEKIYIDINISDNSSISISEIKLVFNEISAATAERAVEITENCVDNKIKVTLEGS